MDRDEEALNARIRLAAAKAGLDGARTEYRLAVADCTAAGVSNVRMASIVGITETAVRMYKDRHGIKGFLDRGPNRRTTG